MKSVHFGLNLPSLAKKGTNLVQFLTFFHPLGTMSDNFCCGLFVQKSALMSLAQLELENAKKDGRIENFQVFPT